MTGCAAPVWPDSPIPNQDRCKRTAAPTNDRSTKLAEESGLAA